MFAKLHSSRVVLTSLLVVFAYGCGQEPVPVASKVSQDVGSAEVAPTQSAPDNTETTESSVQVSSTEPEVTTEPAVVDEDKGASTSGGREDETDVQAPPLEEPILKDQWPKWEMPLAGGLQVYSGYSSTAERDVVLQAHTAMAGRDLLTANSILREALLQGGGTLPEVERSWLLCRLLVKFWSAARQGISTIRKDERLALGDREYTVDTLTTSSLFLRSDDGELIKEPTALGQMSASLAESLARRRLTESGPVADRIVAAFHAVDQQGQKERLRVLCRRMYGWGLNVDLFLPELEGSKQ